MSVQNHLSIVLEALGVILLVYLPAKLVGAKALRILRTKLARRDIESPGTPREKGPLLEINSLNPEAPYTRPWNDQSRELRRFKEFYFKVQNLERFPEILLPARDLLISLFGETLAAAQSSHEPGILSLSNYSPDGLASFIKEDHDRLSDRWESYVAKRRAGSPTELFQDQQEAKWWLKQLAPVKYVDGAWLGHIHKVTTPFELRRVTKDAWQVLSEELGDGDAHKNHVYVYRELMKEIEAGLPEADTADFTHPRHQLDELCVWKAAVAQLLISLFPHEFLPEILGFNLHFEGLTMETMKGAKEVEDIGLNPYYFVLHISIDNADSGHTAIAMQAVMKYLEQIRQTEGDLSAQNHWKRVQAGFILSQGLSAGPVSPSKRVPAVNSFPRNEREAQVVRIFKAKAPVAHKIHCACRMTIAGRKLYDWLEPKAFAGKQWQMDFLDHLSNMKPWVRRGDSNNSKLIQYLSWQGKMFGSFTQSEVEIVKGWIDGLEYADPQVYWSHVDKEPVQSEDILQNPDIRIDYPVLSPVSVSDLSSQRGPTQPQTQNCVLEKPDLARLLPLWFTSPCLLESFISIPSKSTTVIASAIVRLLRAQYGFGIEGPGVAGMDEVRRDDCAGLNDLGLIMIRRSSLPEPSALKDVLETWPSDFAIRMLHLSMRPMANFGFLLGLAWAFVDLHEAMISSGLFTASEMAALAQIVQRERDCLKVCFEELQEDGPRYADFHRGHELGREEVEYCLGNDLMPEKSLPVSMLL